MWTASNRDTSTADKRFVDFKISKIHLQPNISFKFERCPLDIEANLIRMRLYRVGRAYL